MNWLREAIEDSSTGLASSKRVGLLLATFALSLSVVILAVAALFKVDTAAALAAVAIPLAGLNGYSYVGALNAENKK
jgi:hypothetical protein